MSRLLRFWDTEKCEDGVGGSWSEPGLPVSDGGTGVGEGRFAFLQS